MSKKKMDRSRKDPWMNKTVKIKEGNYKGYIGIVKNATDGGLRIQLHATMKPINAKREQVRVVHEDGREITDDLNTNNFVSNRGRGGGMGGSGLGRGGGGGGPPSGGTGSYRSGRGHTTPYSNPGGRSTHSHVVGSGGGGGGGGTTPHHSSTGGSSSTGGGMGGGGIGGGGPQRRSNRRSHRNGGGIRGTNNRQHPAHRGTDDPRFGGLTGGYGRIGGSGAGGGVGGGTGVGSSGIGVGMRRNNEFRNRSFDAQTPQIGMRTPAYGEYIDDDGNDDMYGGRTPAMGMTPAHGGIGMCIYFTFLFL